MADGKPFRVVPDRWRWSIRQSWGLPGKIALIVSTNKKRLPVSQIKVQLARISVIRSRRGSIEAKAAGVDAISDSRVVRDITPGFVGEEGDRSGINAGRNAVRREIRIINLNGIQTAKPR